MQNLRVFLLGTPVIIVHHFLLQGPPYYSLVKISLFHEVQSTASSLSGPVSLFTQEFFLLLKICNICCFLIGILLSILQFVSTYLFLLILLFILYSSKHPIDVSQMHSVGDCCFQALRDHSKDGGVFVLKELAGCISHLLWFLILFLFNI